MSLDFLKALYVRELNDLHDAESQLVQALPTMVKTASSEDLRLALERHWKQTKRHLQRLERAFSLLKEKPKQAVCKAEKGIFEEADEMIRADDDSATKDMAFIWAVQRSARREMAKHGCARTYAESLGEADVAEMHQKTLDEECSMDDSLAELSKRLVRAKPVLYDGLDLVGFF